MGTPKSRLVLFVRLFIADADQELRVSLQLLLHQEPGMLVVGIADHARGLLAQLAPSQPDVLLLDWLLPGRPAEALLADLNALEQRPQIIVLSVRPEVESAAIAAGADAFVTKAVPADRLLAILRDMRSKPVGDALPSDGASVDEA
jgi:two-component system response regulator RegX3